MDTTLEYYLPSTLVYRDTTSSTVNHLTLLQWDKEMRDTTLDSIGV